MSSVLEIITQPTITITAILPDGDKGYERVRKVEDYLRHCYPDLKIGGLRWDVEKKHPPDHYEFKIETPLPEEIRRLAEEIKAKISNFLRTLD